MDPRGLLPGTYSGTVTATVPGDLPGEVPVTLRVMAGPHGGMRCPRRSSSSRVWPGPACEPWRPAPVHPLWVLAAAGCRHTTISPNAGEHDGIRRYCGAAGISTESVTFMAGYGKTSCRGCVARWIWPSRSLRL